MVGNGDHLTCSNLCPQVPLKIQDHTFTIPCYLIPIEGADVVLGLDWLSTLGPISANFATPSLSFIHQNTPITLAGTTTTTLQFSSYNTIQHLSHTNSIASCHLLSILPITLTTNSSTMPTININHLHPETQSILQKFPLIFQTQRITSF